MKTALISVSDKTGLVPLANALIEADYRIVSTGGTARFLSENNIQQTPVEDLTGFPEILDGRVKTLHPHIMGGILADSTNPAHKQELTNLGINSIDIVVVNLYPFAEVYQNLNNPDNLNTGQSHSLIIENIDIGGVTLLRAAAKNYQSVTVISDVSDYDKIIELLGKQEALTEQLKLSLALKAFNLTSAYDRLISSYLHQISNDPSPSSHSCAGKNPIFNRLSISELLFSMYEKRELRYGENPHQQGGYLQTQENGMIDVIYGKELSYNNYLDIDSSLKLIMKFPKPTASIIKHTNPCGVASDEQLGSAYQRCFQTDTQSPFGGIVTVNRKLDLITAKAINEVFTEIIIAPEYEEDALRFLKLKKMRRLIRYHQDYLKPLQGTDVFVSCLGGMLCQNVDIGFDNPQDWKTVTSTAIPPSLQTDLAFAWAVVSSLKSNAICIAKNEATIGMGMGQTSRVDSMEFAIRRATKYGHQLTGAVCASDGFFPFRDSIDMLAEHGIKAIIQPGGSKGDEEVIRACNEYGIAMIFTGMRHFNH